MIQHLGFSQNHAHLHLCLYYSFPFFLMHLHNHYSLNFVYHATDIIIIKIAVVNKWLFFLSFTLATR